VVAVVHHVRRISFLHVSLQHLLLHDQGLTLCYGPVTLAWLTLTIIVVLLLGSGA